MRPTLLAFAVVFQLAACLFTGVAAEPLPPILALRTHATDSETPGRPLVWLAQREMAALGIPFERSDLAAASAPASAPASVPTD